MERVASDKPLFEQSRSRPQPGNVWKTVLEDGESGQKSVWYQDENDSHSKLAVHGPKCSLEESSTQAFHTAHRYPTFIGMKTDTRKAPHGRRQLRPPPTTDANQDKKQGQSANIPFTQNYSGQPIAAHGRVDNGASPADKAFLNIRKHIDGMADRIVSEDNAARSSLRILAQMYSHAQSVLQSSSNTHEKRFMQNVTRQLEAQFNSLEQGIKLQRANAMQKFQEAHKEAETIRLNLEKQFQQKVEPTKGPVLTPIESLTIRSQDGDFKVVGLDRLKLAKVATDGSMPQAERDFAKVRQYIDTMAERIISEDNYAKSRLRNIAQMFSRARSVMQSCKDDKERAFMNSEMQRLETTFNSLRAEILQQRANAMQEFQEAHKEAETIRLNLEKQFQQKVEPTKGPVLTPIESLTIRSQDGDFTPAASALSSTLSIQHEALQKVPPGTSAPQPPSTNGRGPPSPPGTQGTSGPRGTSGSVGTSAPQPPSTNGRGPPSPPGTQGTSGPRGTSGSVGTSAPQPPSTNGRGPPSPPGTQGTSGPRGTSGSVGTSAPQLPPTTDANQDKKQGQSANIPFTQNYSGQPIAAHGRVDNGASPADKAFLNIRKHIDGMADRIVSEDNAARSSLRILAQMYSHAQSVLQSSSNTHEKRFMQNVTRQLEAQFNSLEQGIKLQRANAMQKFQEAHKEAETIRLNLEKQFQQKVEPTKGPVLTPIESLTIRSQDGDFKVVGLDRLKLAKVATDGSMPQAERDFAKVRQYIDTMAERIISEDNYAKSRLRNIAQMFSRARSVMQSCKDDKERAFMNSEMQRLETTFNSLRAEILQQRANAMQEFQEAHKEAETIRLNLEKQFQQKVEPTKGPVLTPIESLTIRSQDGDFTPAASALSSTLSIQHEALQKVPPGTSAPQPPSTNGRGPPSPPGTQGTSGPRGTSGSVGTSAPQPPSTNGRGPPSPPGTQGTSGPRGTSGSVGTSAPQPPSTNGRGPPSPPGTQGTSGPRGTSGSVGTSAPQLPPTTDANQDKKQGQSANIPFTQNYSGQPIAAHGRVDNGASPADKAFLNIRKHIDGMADRIVSEDNAARSSLRILAQMYSHAQSVLQSSSNTHEKRFMQNVTRQLEAQFNSLRAEILQQRANAMQEFQEAHKEAETIRLNLEKQFQQKVEPTKGPVLTPIESLTIRSQDGDFTPAASALSSTLSIQHEALQKVPPGTSAPQPPSTNGRGPPSPPGTQGTSGPRGTSGSVGTSAPQPPSTNGRRPPSPPGTQGTSGPRGTSGSVGTSAPQPPSTNGRGPPSPPGTQGTSGPRGTSGSVGTSAPQPPSTNGRRPPSPPGTQGTSGPRGTSGSVGTSAPQPPSTNGRGPPSPPGTQGTSGPRGTSGSVGTSAPQPPSTNGRGPPSPPGTQGTSGPRGTSGSVGTSAPQLPPTTDANQDKKQGQSANIPFTQNYSGQPIAAHGRVDNGASPADKAFLNIRKHIDGMADRIVSEDNAARSSLRILAQMYSHAQSVLQSSSNTHEKRFMQNVTRQLEAQFNSLRAEILQQRANAMQEFQEAHKEAETIRLNLEKQFQQKVEPTKGPVLTPIESLTIRSQDGDFTPAASALSSTLSIQHEALQKVPPGTSAPQPPSTNGRGPPSPPGTQGTSGPRGTSGSVGTSAPQPPSTNGRRPPSPPGTQGTSGPRGTSGSVGTSAPQPPSTNGRGPPSPPGTQGTSGPRGTSGSVGTSAPQPPSTNGRGPPSPPGTQGTSGPRGTSGSVGTSAPQPPSTNGRGPPSPQAPAVELTAQAISKLPFISSGSNIRKIKPSDSGSEAVQSQHWSKLRSHVRRKTWNRAMDRGLGYIPGGKPGGWTAPTAGDLPYLKGYHGSLPKPLHTSNWKHEADTDPLAKAAEYPEKHIDATAQNGPIKVKSLDLDVTGDIWNNDRGGQFRPIGANQAELPDAIPAAHSIVNIQSHAEGGVDANGRKDINRTRVKNFVRKPSSTVHNNKQSTHSTAVTIPKEARKSVRARKSLQTDKVAAVISETSRRSVTDENDDISSSIEPDEYEEAMTRSSTGVLIAGGFFSSVLLITGGLVVYLKRKE